MNKTINYILFISLVIASCKQHILDPSEEQHLAKGQVIFKILPCHANTLLLVNSFIANANLNLNLYSIENGFDSIQLRIWFCNADNKSDSTNHLLIVKKAKSKPWSAHMVSFTYPIFGSVALYTLPKTIEHNNIQVKDSLVNFLESSVYKLLENGGLTIKCQKYSNDRVSNNIMIIELSLREVYYVGRFPLPSDIKKECGCVEQKKLIELLSLLKNEYHYKFLNDYLK